MRIASARAANLQEALLLSFSPSRSWSLNAQGVHSARRHACSSRRAYKASEGHRSLWSTKTSKFLLAFELSSLIFRRAPHLSRHHIYTPTAMDAFFTIASPVPVEEPTVEETLVNSDTYGSGLSHANCVIA